MSLAMRGFFISEFHSASHAHINESLSVSEPEKCRYRWRPLSGGFSVRQAHFLKGKDAMNHQLANLDFRDMVVVSGDRVITTSRKVAAYFDKQHHHIIQKIEKLDCSDEFLTSNFSRVTYEHKGNQYVEYEISKDGAMYIIMSFTGKKAAAIKEVFIKAFNWMRDRLMEMAHSYQREHNELMLEFMKEKDVASMSGRLLNRWGRIKKPQLIARIERLEQQAQISIPGLPK